MILLQYKKVSILHFLSLLMVLVPFSVYAQTTVEKGSFFKKALNSLYIHGGVGIGLDFYSSSQINSVLPDGFGVGRLDFPRILDIRAGFRNIVQVEHRIQIANHTIRKSGFVDGGGFGGTGIGTVAETKMHYRSYEWLIKFNPFFMKKQMHKPKDNYDVGISGIFFIYGTSNISYLDDVKDGWEGSGTFFGIEHFLIYKYSSLSVGATWHSISYDSVRLFSIPIAFEFDASQLLIYMNFGIGIGL